MSKGWILILVPLMLAVANISNAFDMMGGIDALYLQTKTVGRVSFSHSVHGAQCDACHPKIFVQKNNSNHVSMKAMEKGKSCGACHNGKKAFSVTANCVTCHAGDILYKDKDNGDVNFSHAVHVDMFGCDKCHPDLFTAVRGRNQKATMANMEAGKSCGACHNGNDAFSVAEDCEKCHKM